MDEAIHTTHQQLYGLYEANRPLYDGHFDSRLRRALSWLKRAEQETHDPDAAFIFYWISFNAGYSPKFNDSDTASEAQKADNFFQMIAEQDSKKIIYRLVWERFSQEIRSLITNEFIYAPFWKYENPLHERGWEASFEKEKIFAAKCLKNQNTAAILALLFRRLYVLRNQLMHGSATWQGTRNRRQVRDGQRVIEKLQPAFLWVMLTNHHKNWGEVSYDLFIGDVGDY